VLEISEKGCQLSAYGANAKTSKAFSIVYMASPHQLLTYGPSI